VAEQYEPKFKTRLWFTFHSWRNWKSQNNPEKAPLDQDLRKKVTVLKLINGVYSKIDTGDIVFFMAKKAPGVLKDLHVGIAVRRGDDIKFVYFQYVSGTDGNEMEVVLAPPPKMNPTRGDCLIVYRPRPIPPEFIQSLKDRALKAQILPTPELADSLIDGNVPRVSAWFNVPTVINNSN